MRWPWGEVFGYNGAAVQLSANGASTNAGSFGQEISGNYVVWYTDPDTRLPDLYRNDQEIFYADLTAPAAIPITANNYDDDQPHVSGSHVVWTQSDRVSVPTLASDEIWHYDIGTTIMTQLTGPDGFGDQNVHIDGTMAAWMHTDADPDIEIYSDDVSTMPPASVAITVHPAPRVYPPVMDDHLPIISGTNMVWVGQKVGPAPETDNEVFYHDLSTSTTTRITNDDGGPWFDDHSADISGKYMVWVQQLVGGGNSTREIMLCDMTTGVPAITPITSDGFGDQDPHISGKNVVWVKDTNNLGTAYDIFLYNIDQATTWQLTNNGLNVLDWQVDIDGNYVVWSGNTGFQTEFEVYQLDIGPIIPEPSTFVLAVFGLLGLAFFGRRRR